MAVMKDKTGNNLIVSCCGGSDDGIRFRIDKEDFDYYCIASYMSGDWYREQDDKLWRVFCKKLNKIWSVIRNKDYYYAEIVMNRDEFEEFKEYVNSI